MELYRDEFGVIRRDEAGHVLELEWTEETARMTDEDFKAWLVRLAETGEGHPAHFMIVDTRLFRYRPGADFAEWRDQNIIPRYNRAGVTKFAFLTPPGMGAASEPAPEGPAQFPTGYFDSRERIDAWLSP